MFSENPFPGDGRFEPAKANDNLFDPPPNLNIEIIDKHRNTTLGPKLGNYSKRKELWPIIDLPDS